MQLFKPHASPTHLLFVLTEQCRFFVLAYDAATGARLKSTTAQRNSLGLFGGTGLLNRRRRRAEERRIQCCQLLHITQYH